MLHALVDVVLSFVQLVWPQNKMVITLRFQLMISMGYIEKSLLYIENQINEQPGDGRFYFLAGQVAQRLGLPELAHSRFVQACIAEPGQTEYLKTLGQQYLRLRRLDDARVLFQGIIEDRPEHRFSLLSLASLARIQSRYQDAEEYLRLLLIEPCEQSLMLATVCAYETGRYPEAIQLARQRMAHKSNDAMGHELLGRAYAAEKNYEPALEHMKSAIRLNPNSGRLRRRYGQILAVTDVVGAHRAFRDALLVAEPDYRAHGDMAMLYADHNDAVRSRSELLLLQKYTASSEFQRIEERVEKKLRFQSS